MKDLTRKVKMIKSVSHMRQLYAAGQEYTVPLYDAMEWEANKWCEVDEKYEPAPTGQTTFLHLNTTEQTNEHIKRLRPEVGGSHPDDSSKKAPAGKTTRRTKSATQQPDNGADR